jgi:hypothetical protein
MILAADLATSHRDRTRLTVHLQHLGRVHARPMPIQGDSVYRFTVPPWTLHMEYGADGREREETGAGNMDITVWSWAPPGTDAQ